MIRIRAYVLKFNRSLMSFLNIKVAARNPKCLMVMGLLGEHEER